MAHGKYRGARKSQEICLMLYSLNIVSMGYIERLCGVSRPYLPYLDKWSRV